jgi:hypothetical protein
MPTSSTERMRVCGRRRRDGVVRLVVYVDALWLSEVLSELGYGMPDDDDHMTLQQRLQGCLDDMVERAQRGDT